MNSWIYQNHPQSLPIRAAPKVKHPLLWLGSVVLGLVSLSPSPKKCHVSLVITVPLPKTSSAPVKDCFPTINFAVSFGEGTGSPVRRKSHVAPLIRGDLMQWCCRLSRRTTTTSWLPQRVLSRNHINDISWNLRWWGDVFHKGAPNMKLMLIMNKLVCS